MANLKILIEGDTNDADYTISSNKITQQQLEMILPVIEAVKNCPKPNWNNYWVGRPLHDLYPEFFEEIPDYDPEYESSYEPSAAFELFGNLVPDGVHTIVSIETVGVESTKLL